MLQRRQTWVACSWEPLQVQARSSSSPSCSTSFPELTAITREVSYFLIYSYYRKPIIITVDNKSSILGEESGFTQIMTKMDDVLARHGIDTTSCMQRAVCTYSQQASSSMKEANKLDDDEKVSSFDRVIDTITTNQIFRTAMQGTAIQEAVEAGRAGRTCSRIYPQCGFSMETMLSLLSNVISAVAAVNTGTTATTGTGTL